MTSAPTTQTGLRLFAIRHHYDAQPQAAAVLVPEDLDPRRAAVYVEWMAEEWFGFDTTLCNETIAAALVRFYGCLPASPPADAYGLDWRAPGVIDMYWHRDYHWDGREGLTEDESLVRDGLREFLEPLGRNGRDAPTGETVNEGDRNGSFATACGNTHPPERLSNLASIDDMPAIRLLTSADRLYTRTDADETQTMLLRLAEELRDMQRRGRIELAPDRSGNYRWEGVTLEFKADGDDQREWDGVPERLVLESERPGSRQETLDLMLSRTRRRSMMPSTWLRIEAPIDDPRLPRHSDTLDERMAKAAATLELFAAISGRMQIGEETLDPDALRNALENPYPPHSRGAVEWVKVVSPSAITEGVAWDWWDRAWIPATDMPPPSLGFSTACVHRKDGKAVGAHLMVEPRLHFVELRRIDEETRRRVAASPSRAACP